MAIAQLKSAVAALPDPVRAMVEVEAALVRRQMRDNPIFCAAVVLAVVHEARQREDEELIPRREALLASLGQNREREHHEASR